jgi:hypothetical protein
MTLVGVAMSKMVQNGQPQPTKMSETKAIESKEVVFIHNTCSNSLIRADLYTMSTIRELPKRAESQIVPSELDMARQFEQILQN